MIEFFNVCYLFRREKANKIKFKDISHTEDILFFIEMAYIHNARYGCVEDFIYIYRKHPNSAMTNHEKLEKGYIFFIKYIKNNLNLPFLFIQILKIIFLIWLKDRNIKKSMLSICHFIVI